MPHAFVRRDTPALTRLVFLILSGLLVFASLAAAQSPEIDERLDPLCSPAPNVLCLQQHRFAVTVDFQYTPLGPSYRAEAVALTEDSGYFWFFDESNVELVVKVLNGCIEPFNSYWFFAAGLTNVGVVIQVTDMRLGSSLHYSSPAGTPFVPIQDTAAFANCP